MTPTIIKPSGTRRFRAGLLATILAVSMIEAFAQSSDGKQPQQGNANPLPPWIVTCSNGNVQAEFKCVMQQTLYVATSRQRIASVTIERARSGFAATVLLPHGIDLTKGLDIWVDDGQRIKVPIRNADQNGSYAPFEIDAGLLEAMRKGGTLRLATTRLAGDELIIEMTLTGFSSSFAILEKN